MQPKPKQKNRPDKIEYEKRLMAIQGWMIDGNPSAIIIQQIVLKGWVKSDRNAYMYYKAALNRWIKYENENRDHVRKMRVQELKNQIRGMSNQYRGTPIGMRAILQITKEINKLEGLYYLDHQDRKTPFDDAPPVSFTNNINLNSTKLTPELIREIDKELEEKY